MKLITLNEKNETAIFEIAKYEETMGNRNESIKNLHLAACLKCYPLNPDEEPFPVFYNDMEYIAVDDIVVKDVTWINDMIIILKRDKISFVELMNEYYKYFGKRYITLESLKFDIEHSYCWFDTDAQYVYNNHLQDNSESE